MIIGSYAKVSEAVYLSKGFFRTSLNGIGSSRSFLKMVLHDWAPGIRSGLLFARWPCSMLCASAAYRTRSAIQSRAPKNVLSIFHEYAGVPVLRCREKPVDAPVARHRWQLALVVVPPSRLAFASAQINNRSALAQVRKNFALFYRSAPPVHPNI